MDITSLDNKLIKHIASLHQKKYRDIENEFIIEGLNSINEAINSNFDIKAILYCPDMIDISNLNIKATSVTKEILCKISDTVTPQGILALCSIPSYDAKKDFSKILFLDRVQDPGNVGTMIRTADAMNFDAVVLSKGCSDPYSLKVIRSTVGSIFHIPVIHDVDTINFLSDKKSKKYSIYASTLKKADFLENITISKPFILIIGNEGQGISSDVENLSDYFVKIEMPGKAESLNASVASGILMYKFKD